MTTQDKREPASFVAVRPQEPSATAVVPVALPPPTPAGAAKARNWPRRLLLLAVLVLVAGGGAWFTWWRPVAVAVVHPWRGAAVEAVYATGIVEAVDTARVGTTVPGRIIALAVNEGDIVRRDQVLAQLDDRQPRSRLEDATARLTQAELELARGRDLQTRGIRTRQEVERVQEERDQAAAGVRLAARQLEEHRILSPLDGVVTKRPVEVGETVAARDTLFEVVSDARLRVAADVDERDIPQVRLGAHAALRSEAFPEQAFSADVTNIRRAGETTTRTFRVEANLPAGTPLRIGMTVDVNIVTSERKNAVLVPALAVRHDPPLGGRPGPAFLFRAEDGRAVRTVVETGAVGADVIEVRRGVSETSTVLAAPPDGLKDGQRIHATEKPSGGTVVTSGVRP